jgi:hypothetical protein
MPGHKNKNGWVAVVQHMKIIGLSVGLLLALSGLAGFAGSHQQKVTSTTPYRSQSDTSHRF